MVLLTDVVLVANIFTLKGTFLAVIEAVRMRNTPAGVRVATQRSRYGLLWLGAALIVFSAALLYGNGTLTEILAAGETWSDRLGWGGAIVAINTYMIALGIWPAVILGSVLYVYRRPVAMAFRVIGRFMGLKEVYITTASKRLGKGHWMPVTPQTVLTYDQYGRPVAAQRIFRAVAPDSDHNTYPIYDMHGRPVPVVAY